jgi:drug/metabolite transporter (DMT)-like permease
LVAAAALLWSTSGVITKALPLDPLAIAFYRGLFAGLVLVPLVPRSRRVFRPLLIPLCLVFGAMTACYLGAVKMTTAANAIYLQYTSTLWTVPLSFWLLGERSDRRSLLAIALAMVGIVAIVGFGHEGRHEWPGIALGLASGLGYAGVTVLIRALRDLDPTWISGVGNLVGALVLGVWIVGYRGMIPVPAPSLAVALIAFGALQMALPYVLFARGLRTIGAPEAGLIALIEPIVNPIWVVLLVHERPTDPTIVGGLFLLAGVACRYVPLPGARPVPASVPSATDGPTQPTPLD